MMAGTFVPPYKLVQTAKQVAEDLRADPDLDPAAASAAARGWEIFAREIELEARAGGYWS